MNPRLIKFTVELQNGEKIEEKDKQKICISFKNSNKKFFNLFNSAVTVPVEKQ